MLILSGLCHAAYNVSRNSVSNCRSNSCCKSLFRRYSESFVKLICILGPADREIPLMNGFSVTTFALDKRRKALETGLLRWLCLNVTYSFLFCTFYNTGCITGASQYNLTRLLSWFTVHGSWFTHISRFTVQISRFTHSSRFMVHESQFTVHGLRFTVHGSRFRHHKSMLSSSIDYSSRLTVHSPRFTVHDSDIIN